MGSRTAQCRKLHGIRTRIQISGGSKAAFVVTRADAAVVVVANDTSVAASKCVIEPPTVKGNYSSFSGIKAGVVN
jgi:hypothetical protein